MAGMLQAAAAISASLQSLNGTASVAADDMEVEFVMGSNVNRMLAGTPHPIDASKTPGKPAGKSLPRKNSPKKNQPCSIYTRDCHRYK
ncbi:hypothetical protein QQP08_004167 [Theobroma cacao]|uniref:Uncharacterized protein n=1 Tax=Theobroma cacao TaxID=3641 RepID=A0A061FS36_THECC|nr:Uncharacterized protein TCM_044598 [Theobroma cacao]WRX11680.1 hypothetical protein QQP08_004167 [Theobroma cacao]